MGDVGAQSLSESYRNVHSGQDTRDKGSHQAEEAVLSGLVSLWDFGAKTSLNPLIRLL